MRTAKVAFFTLIFLLFATAPVVCTNAEGRFDARTDRTQQADADHGVPFDQAINKVLAKMNVLGLSEEKAKKFLEHLTYIKLVIMKDRSASLDYMERFQKIWAKLMIPLKNLEQLQLDNRYKVVLGDMAYFLACLNHVDTNKTAADEALEKLKKTVRRLPIHGRQESILLGSFDIMFRLTDSGSGYIDHINPLLKKELGALSDFSESAKDEIEGEQERILDLLTQVYNLQELASGLPYNAKPELISNVCEALKQPVGGWNLPDPPSEAEKGKNPEYRWALIAAGAAGLKLSEEQLKYCIKESSFSRAERTSFRYERMYSSGSGRTNRGRYEKAYASGSGRTNHGRYEKAYASDSGRTNHDTYKKTHFSNHPFSYGFWERPFQAKSRFFLELGLLVAGLLVGGLLTKIVLTGALKVVYLVRDSMYHIKNKLIPGKVGMSELHDTWTASDTAVVLTIAVVLVGALYYGYTRKKGLGKS